MCTILFILLVPAFNLYLLASISSSSQCGNHFKSLNIAEFLTFIGNRYSSSTPILYNAMHALNAALFLAFLLFVQNIP